MRSLLPLTLLVAVTSACAPAVRSVRLVSFSDYHSHAVPFYSEDRPDQGGIARAIAYLKEARQRPGTLVVSGGDTMNAGVPTWSDAYQCLEWPWLNGLVDVMALGNHDFDYGPEAFARCQQGITYPVLCANLLRADGTPFFQVEGKPYLVREVAGVRVGFFAVAGPDIQRLVKREQLPVGARWGDSVETAREMVRVLRGVERVDAVVFIGHQLREDDEAMARAVPGIDVILGTHSHYLGQPSWIPGTRTFYLSPYQYLTYVAEVDLRFEGHRLAGVEGRLVRMDSGRPADAEVASRVAGLQQALEQKRPDRFEVLGVLPAALSDSNVSRGESVVGNWVTGVLREAAGVHAFFLTASSIRASLPPGPLTVEGFYSAIPYRNALMTVELSAAQLLEWLALSVSKRDSDGFSQQSGLRYSVREGRPVEVLVLKDPSDVRQGFVPVDPDATYRVGTVDFQARVAAGYRELFAAGRAQTKTGLDAHTLLMDAVRQGRVSAALDGRCGGE